MIPRIVALVVLLAVAGWSSLTWARDLTDSPELPDLTPTLEEEMACSEEACICCTEGLAGMEARLIADRELLEKERELWKQLGKHALLREIAEDLTPQVLQMIREEVKQQLQAI